MIQLLIGLSFGAIAAAAFCDMSGLSPKLVAVPALGATLLAVVLAFTTHKVD